ncbi:MAG TPA: DUF5947 family protein [Terriglobia bacterium]|nr:DUF5947 family protein [Terriglobia bacterium]
MSSKPAPITAESCDFCRAAVAERHQHVMDAANWKIQCVCDACAVLFGSQGQTKYLRVPRRIRFLPNFRLTDDQWDGLLIPIAMAFLFHSSRHGKVVALYPSPAGPVESQLTLESWEEIASSNPELANMQKDVEGLLVYRVGSAREHFVVPIDECFALIGIIRTQWKGLSGGSTMWNEVRTFLAALKERSH